MVKPLFAGTSWDFSDIQRIYDAVEEVGVGEMGLNIYRNQLEIISAEQMLDAYSSHGLPVMYPHWSFGKHFARDEALYRKGYQGLAYEIVINSDPCINYLMEENSATMQTLVIAHAAMGHNHFFKNNFLYRHWTDAGSILDYMSFAKDYVIHCERKHGTEAVEQVLDAAHALMDQGVFRHKRPGKPNRDAKRERMERRLEEIDADQNELWSTLPKRPPSPVVTFDEEDWDEIRLPEENILYFLEKNSPKLKGWQRELLRIVRMTAQYFHPNRQTKMANEGCATFVHYHILHRLYDKGLLTEGSILEAMHSHSSVVYQPGFDSRYYSGINPYALGFNMMMDIKRMCLEPTQEDHDWFPHIAGNGDWLGVLKDAWANYRDESFVAQFLSPKVIRDMKLFSIMDDSNDDSYYVSDIHDERGYRRVRKHLSEMYDIGLNTPDVQVVDMDPKTRQLLLVHNSRNGLHLEPNNGAAVNDLVERLWGFEVLIEERKIPTPAVEGTIFEAWD